MWDEENEEKKGFGQNLADKAKEKGKEKAQEMAKKGAKKVSEKATKKLTKKAAGEAVKKQAAKKAAQEVTKQVASKAALAGPLGYVLFWAIIVILIIIVVVGIVMFVVTMPGMVMDKLKEIGRAIGNAIASYFGADDTELAATEEKQFAVLKYLQDMGYDLAGEGFLQTIYDDNDLKSLGYTTETAKTVKSDGGIIKDKDGNIKNADSFVVYNYLVSDNYVYTISNFNMVTNDSNGFQWWDAFQALWGHVCNIFGGAGSEMWGRGLISLYLEGDNIGERGDFYVNDIFGWNDIELDAEAKTLSIRRGWGSNKMVYSLDGWTGRYGMPLEFLLSVHLATKMPDLAYDMTRAFGAGQNKGGEDEGTEVEILLHELEGVSAVSAYKADWGDKDYIKYAEFDGIKSEGWFFTDGWTLSKEEAYKIIKLGINSPDNCTYLAPTFELLDATDNGDGWVWDDNKAAELALYGITEDDYAEVEADLAETVADTTDEEFAAKEAMLQVNNENAKGALESTAKQYGYDASKATESVETSTENGWGGQYAQHESGTCKKKDDIVSKTYTEEKFNEEYMKCPDHTRKAARARDQKRYNRYIKKDPSYYKIEKSIITREWTYKNHNDESEDATYRWVSYVYKVYKYTDEARTKGKKYITTYFFDYVMKDLTQQELIDAGVLNEDGTTKDEKRCSDAAKGGSTEVTKCCENCRKYVKRIIKLLKAGDDEEFDTYTPYISKVTGHWYRDVYFVTKGNDEFVQLDEEYEAVMGERWTLYETDEDTGLPILYKLNSDGSLGAKFDGTQQDADEQGIAVTKKAKTIKFNGTGEQDADELIGWEESGGIWSAYRESTEKTTGAWEHLYPEDEYEEEPIKEKMFVQITTPNDITQIEEGQRTQTNKTIRDIFLNNTYFRYDGSVQTAEIIEELRAAVFGTNEDDIHYGELSEDDLEKTATYNGETYKVKDFAGKVELTQNSLTAFSMLENTHTLDADYIYKDFKELIVELGYFTKEELTDETPRIFAFPVPEIGSGGFPIASLDKKENEFGTQLHSKEDYEANEKNTLKELIKNMGSEIPEEIADQQAAAVTNPIEGLLNVSGNFNLSEIGAINQAEKNVSQVSITEFLETTREMCEYINQEGYDYCVLVGDAGNGEQRCHHGEVHGNSCSLPTTFEASKESVGKHNFCCATLVSWALQNVKVMPDSAHQDGADNLADWVANNLNAKKVDSNQEIKPGDILCYGGHVDLVGEKIDGGFVKYNGGHYVAANSVEYAGSSCIQKISGTTPSANGADFALRLNWGNSSGSGEAFEGYEGGESVVSPVTGILLEYGTYDETIDPLTGKKSRINVDMKYNVNSVSSNQEDTGEPKVGEEPKTEQPEVIDKVGYAKIMIIDDETYLAIENKMKSSATKALGGFDSLVDKDGNYYENKEVKKDYILDEDSDKKWTEDDITLYGYKEFAEMYSDFGVSGNIIYIDGFVCESTFKDPDAKEETEEQEKVEGEKSEEKDVKGDPLTMSSFTEEYKGTLYEKEDRYNLSSQDATNKLNNENDIKDKAPTVMKVTIDGEEKIVIKEGTVIGRTMTNKELVESRGETYVAPTSIPVSTEIEGELNGDSTKENKNLVQGNYLRIIMRDLDDTVVENVEEYMKLDETGSGISSESQEYQAQENDLQILTNLLHHEGCQGYFASIAFDGNQELGAAASRATGYVLINRALADYGGNGTTITDQIKAPGQYETADKVLNGEAVTCELCMANAEWCLTYDCSSLESPDGEPMPRDIFGQSGWCQCNGGKYSCWWWIDTTGDGTQTEYTPGNSYDTFYCK